MASRLEREFGVHTPAAARVGPRGGGSAEDRHPFLDPDEAVPGLKETRPEVLADAVRTVAGGEALLAPSVLRQLVERHQAEAGRADPTRLDVLTDREVELLRLIGRGANDLEIAAALWITESTVKTTSPESSASSVSAISAQAVVAAYETGLVAPGEDA